MNDLRIKFISFSFKLLVSCCLEDWEHFLVTFLIQWPLILFLFFHLRTSWMKAPMFWIFSFVIHFVVSLARPTWCMSAPGMWLFIHCFMLMSGLPLGTIFTIFTTFSNFERFHYFGNILWKKSWFSWVHTRSKIYSLIFTMVDNLNAI